MNIKNFFQKILDGYDDTVPSDDFDDDEPVYTPKNTGDDELVAAPVRPAAPARHTAAAEELTAVKPAAAQVTPVPKKPRFKKISATRLKSGEQIISLAKEGYVVLVDANALTPAVLTNLRYYLAGAVYALGAHIYPVEETMFLFSVEEFDVEGFISSRS